MTQQQQQNILIQNTQDPSYSMMPITDREFRLIRQLVYDKAGICLGEHKRSLIVGRLQKILRQQGFTDFTRYYKHVISDNSGNSLSKLIDRISTNHTYFYREHDHFEYFSNIVLSSFINGKKNQSAQDLRIWCPGCSSGEEPYMLAMLILEANGFDNNISNPMILATDISTTALDKASAGVYRDENVSRLSKRLTNKYFQRMQNSSEMERSHVINSEDTNEFAYSRKSDVNEGNLIINNRIKKMVMFRKLNLMREEFPFKQRFHVIFCRNVMIYFDNPTRQALVRRFARYTEPGGYLFIGHSETLGRNNEHYNYIKPAIYRRNRKI